MVDNGSRDGSAEAVRAQFPQVELLALPENRWYCAANNLGLAKARGTYALLLNPDTQIEVDAAHILTEFMERHPQYHGCTGQLYGPSGDIQRTGSRLPNYPTLLLLYSALGWVLPWWRRALLRHYQYADWDRNSDRDIEVMPGSCFLARRENLRLDERFWLYFPEDAYAARRERGRRFRYVSAARIQHRAQGSTRNRRAQRVFFRDLATYLRTHHGLAAWAFWWLFALPFRLILTLSPNR